MESTRFFELICTPLFILWQLQFIYLIPWELFKTSVNKDFSVYSYNKLVTYISIVPSLQSIVMSFSVGFLSTVCITRKAMITKVAPES